LLEFERWIACRRLATMLCLPIGGQSPRCLGNPASAAAPFKCATPSSASLQLARVLCATLASTASITSRVAIKARGKWSSAVKPADGRRRGPQTPLEVLFEDDALLLVDKPAGMLSQAATPGGESLCSEARRHLGRSSGSRKTFVGLIHRLDRDVTGVCALAKTSAAAKWMSTQFAGRLACKEYLAVVRSWSRYDGPTRLEHRYAVDENGQAFEAAEGDAGARDCSLICHPVASGPSGVTALLVRLLTGRRHQIRYQLAAEGSPLLGDSRYGSGPRDGSRRWIQRPALHAWSLSFNHPTPPHSNCEVVAPVPADMTSLMNAVGIDIHDAETEAAKAAIAAASRQT